MEASVLMRFVGSFGGCGCGYAQYSSSSILAEVYVSGVSWWFYQMNDDE